MPSTLKSLKLLSDPTRLRILLLIEEEPLSVADLQTILGMAQSRISTQLSQLKNGKLVIDQRSGKNNIYRAQLPPDLAGLARSAAAEVPEIDKDRAAMRHMLRKRRDKARAYFDELAGRFGRDYVPGRSWKGLAEAMIKVLPFRVVADLGSGEGTLSQLLAQRAEKVIAVDISEKMVAFGQQLAREHDLPNLEFRIGEIEAPPIGDAEVDLALLSQALHHAGHPPRALAEAFRILRPGGRLIILDLLQHSFEEARDLYADRWLGFSEADLAGMLADAGFHEIETAIVDREPDPPRFATLLGVAVKPTHPAPEGS